MAKAKYAKQVNKRKNPKFGYDEWDWACTVCGKVYPKHCQAAACCGNKKEWNPGYTYEQMLELNKSAQDQED